MVGAVMDSGDNVVALGLRRSAKTSRRRSAAYDRLEKAVSNMEAQLKIQQSGMEVFCSNLEQLKVEVSEMRKTFLRFQDNIGNTKLGSLRRSSIRLHQIADGWLSRSQ